MRPCRLCGRPTAHSVVAATGTPGLVLVTPACVGDGVADGTARPAGERVLVATEGAVS